MTPAEQERFDTLLQDAIDGLPARARRMLDEVPLVVMDRPTDEMVAELRRDGVIHPDEDGSELCGLHTGVGLPERSIDHPEDWGGVFEQIHLFREGIVSLAGGWNPRPDFKDDDEVGPGGEDEIYEEVRITLLHEIGHHFGLDEDDLEDLGYA